MFSARHRVIKDQGKLHANIRKLIRDLLIVFQELRYQELNITLKDNIFNVPYQNILLLMNFIKLISNIFKQIHLYIYK